MTSVTQIRSVPQPELASTTSAPSAALPTVVQWRSWPLADGWRRLWPFALLISVVLMAITVSSGSFLAFALVALAFVAATRRIWLPIRYEVNSRGLVQSCLGRVRRLDWSAVQRLELLPDGLRLLWYAEPGPFDAWRSLFVPWKDHKGAVLAIILQGFPNVTENRSAD